MPRHSWDDINLDSDGTWHGMPLCAVLVTSMNKVGMKLNHGSLSVWSMTCNPSPPPGHVPIVNWICQNFCTFSSPFIGGFVKLYLLISFFIRGDHLTLFLWCTFMEAKQIQWVWNSSGIWQTSNFFPSDSIHSSLLVIRFSDCSSMLHLFLRKNQKVNDKLGIFYGKWHTSNESISSANTHCTNLIWIYNVHGQCSAKKKKSPLSCQGPGQQNNFQ